VVHPDDVVGVVTLMWSRPACFSSRRTESDHPITAHFDAAYTAIRGLGVNDVIAHLGRAIGERGKGVVECGLVDIPQHDRRRLLGDGALGEESTPSPSPRR
jgi:hypothetical protein